ncbi:MotA/TolQ/ExbB proton channel family protein [Kangiella sediminilitoris]|uniref:MotA/TolQ/ExbB proton channel n=1 Tax=Kangiella sediminilitoris TaxID=1144748 RepID=A0A1B3BAR5_9GAMM|nr:MotA/TolQ/ExbB proton channel family protein [Kangiella sediminilitoris]AOE49877.1 MotA/TolQ/ExbB proton channel [Kangiella sediminilitoris]
MVISVTSISSALVATSTGTLFDLLKAGGWTMLPIAICSLVAVGIIVERFWALKRERILPKHLVAQVWTWIKQGQFDKEKMRELKASSELGEVLTAGLLNHQYGREAMKASIDEAGRAVVVRLERYLNMLGSIALVAPLLGLLGTVIGMIKVFTVMRIEGVGNANALAGGISEALVTTAAGMAVAIPTLVMHRLFIRRVEELVADMEQEALKMVEVLHGEREIFTSN